MQVTGNISIQPSGPVDGTQANSDSALFSNLSVGETVNAEVVSVSGKEVTLRTADGKEFQAQFPKGVPVSAGDMVELAMVGKDAGTLHLRLSTVNGQTVNLESSELQVYLMKMGVPPSHANEAATQLLLQHHIEPTPEKIAFLFRVAANLPELPTSVAVLMTANGIPPTQENAEILMKWSSAPATLGEDAEAVGQLIRQAVPERFAEIFSDVAQLQAAPEQEIIFRGAGFEKLAAQLALPETTDAEAQVMIRSYLEPLQLAPKENQAAAAKLMEVFHAVKEAGNTIEFPTHTVSGAEQKAPALEMESDRALPQELARHTDAVRTETPLPSAAPAGENGEAAKLLEMLGHLFVRMKGQDIPADAKALQDTVGKQQDLAEALKGGVAKLLGETSPAAQKTNDMSAQVRLGNNMEQFYYCQIPYTVPERKGTAELYVFERRRNTPSSEDENVTVLIGLDTQYMGRLETVLRSQAGSEDLSVEFRVESENVKRFFQESADEFAAQMEEDGFHLGKIRVTKMNEPVTPLNALKVMEREEEVRITGIDIQV